jgi:glycine cleavage system H protein
MSKINKNVFYTKDHQWVSIEDGIATIGITDHSQRELGDIIFLEIYEDSSFEKEDIIGIIEADGNECDIVCPLSGEIVEINEDIIYQPDQINNDPYGIGWIIKIEITNESEIDDLLSPEEYRELI